MSGERTEKATPRRRNEARDEGRVARSQEVNSALVLGVTFAALALTAPSTGDRLHLVFTTTMARVAAPDLTAETVGDLAAEWLRTVGLLCLPLLLAAAVAGLLASVVQNRPTLRTKALKPDLKRLNPLKGIKQWFSPQSGVELAKGILKIVVVGAAATAVIWPQLPQLVGLGTRPPSVIAAYAGSLVLRLAFAVIGILVPLGIADLVYQRRRHEKSLRMTKDEVKQEHRQQDVAPEIKNAIRRRAAEMARRRQLGDVPSADVIVTNPTHFAVALRYGKDVAAPRVIAKGADLLALRIREIGAEHDVTIVENPPLARALFAQCEVGDEIPGELFGAVAEVLAFVFRTSRRALSWA